MFLQGKKYLRGEDKEGDKEFLDQWLFEGKVTYKCGEINLNHFQSNYQYKKNWEGAGL